MVVVTETLRRSFTGRHLYLDAKRSENSEETFLLQRFHLSESKVPGARRKVNPVLYQICLKFLIDKTTLRIKDAF